MINAYSNNVAPSFLIISPVAFAEPPRSATVCRKAGTSCDQIVDNHDSVVRCHPSFLHLKDILSIFFNIFRLDSLSREFSSLADRNEANVETEGKRRRENEAARIKADDHRGL